MTLLDAVIIIVSLALTVGGFIAVRRSYEWEHDLHSRNLSGFPARLLRPFGWIAFVAGILGIAVVVYTYWPKL